MITIATLVGNPQPASRTRLVAESVASLVGRRTGADVRPTLDLAEFAHDMFTFPHSGLDAHLAEVAEADLVIVASPTYKAAYTGLLKAFLDRYGAAGLRGVTAIPLLTIGSPGHALAADFTLRPLLVELGASVPTPAIAFPTSELDDRERVIGHWLDDAWAPLARALEVER